MSSNTDGDKSKYFRDLIKWETEGERTPAQHTFNGQALVRIADAWVTPETAAEFLAECAA